RGYDYAAEGAYFVTINTHDRSHLFGNIVADANGARINLSAHGQIVQDCWDFIPDHFPNVHLDTFQIMPDHIHAIVVILNGNGDPTDPIIDRPSSSMALRFVPGAGAGRGSASTLRGERRPNGVAPRSLGAIVGSFKSAVTKRINLLRGTPGALVWQHNYHDRIIRDAAEHDRIAAYIADNPAKWMNARA
ncbi:MAG: hypothetical protein WAT74_07815, partial [Flavobacteriales bacterium]